MDKQDVLATWAFFSCYTERIQRGCVYVQPLVVSWEVNSVQMIDNRIFANELKIIQNDRNDMYRIWRACRGVSRNGLGDFLLLEGQVRSWGFGLL